jgi:hypothetical protein
MIDDPDVPREIGAAPPVPWQPVRGILVMAASVLVLGGGIACSSTAELSSDAVTTTNPPKEQIDPLDEIAGPAGQAGIQQLQDLVDRLLASNDPCAILTQRDVQENQLDPTLFTSSAARQTLASGLVDVYDHLIQISPVAIQQALSDQKAVFAQVLEVVDRYANTPNDPGATTQIEDLLAQPGMVGAQQQINAFITQNCI